MAPAVVRDAGLKTASGFGDTTTGSFSVLPAVGNHVIAGIAMWEGAGVGFGTVTDNQSNTWSSSPGDRQQIGSGWGQANIFSCKVTTSSGTFTITVNPSNASNNFAAWTAIEVSGLDATTHLDRTGAGTNTTGDALATASAVNTTNDGIAVAVAAVNNADTDINIDDTPPSGYTNVQFYNDSSAIVGFSMVYKIYSASETSSAQFTHDNTSQTGWAAVIATYKEAADVTGRKFQRASVLG